MSGFEIAYSGLDRLLHRLAMGQLELQKSLSQLEDRRFERDLTAVTADRPVFITALPRAGTTVLLETLAGTGAFASHTYRHMPFLLCPMLWDRYARGFRRTAAVRERAHGDGLTIDYDSVEAFEEVLWRAFWSDHFRPDRIRPWSPDEVDTDRAFVAFFHRHRRKIVALARQRGDGPAPTRYLSKNNANVARLAWLERQVPDATILLLYRRPEDQIASLLRQHRNFLALQARDRFVRVYMESIGHFEFGHALRPIDFDGWVDRASAADPLTPDFWADYWIAAYSAVLSRVGPRCRLVSFDRLCRDPAVGLRRLAALIDLEPDLLVPGAVRLTPPAGDRTSGEIDRARLARLGTLVSALDAKASI